MTISIECNLKMKKNSVLKRHANNEFNQKKFKIRKQNFENDDSKISKSDLYKPPTVEELNQLRETEILFNSNLFRLQTEELVKEVTLKEKRRREINCWLEKFENYVNNLPEYDDLNLSDFNACLEQVKHVKLKGILKNIAKNKPLSLKTDQDAPVKLFKPDCVQVVGLYPLNATIGPIVNVTVNVVMPKNCFHAKDYLNARYLIKRSLYLSYLGTHLKESDFTSSVSYSYLNGNELHPILQIATNEVKKTVFEVLVTPKEDTFKPSRFSNDKSNLRWSYWDNCVNRSNKLEIGNEEQCPTPWYNAVLGHDATVGARDKWAREALQGQLGARDALLLLAVWLRQRELHGVGEALVLGLVAHLADTGRLHRHMSSYQAVRQIWMHLATWDAGAGLLLQHCDLTAHLPPTLLERVQQEARIALEHLDAADLNAFQVLFITRQPACMQYDVVINIYNTPALEHVYREVDDNRKLNYLTFKYPLVVNQLIETLRTGLTDRITCIVARPPDNAVWDIEEGTHADTEAEDALYVSLGLRLDPTNMFRVVDKGPPAYDPQAATFRTFWGDKAELRRFKDGSISEAVYWPANLFRDKRKICKSIIEYVLKDKYKLKNYNIVYDQFEAVLESSSLPVEEGNLRVVSEFDSLAKRLRELQLPLSISSVAGVSASFSHSDTFPPGAVNHQVTTKTTYEWNSNAMLKDKLVLRAAPTFVAPIEAIIQMVHNSKWPGELGAMRALRGALLLQAAEQLRRSGLACSVGPTGQLDVSSGGLVSRLELYHPRELTVLDSAVAEARQLRCELLPRLRGALAGLHALRPALGPAAALARRWTRAQLLDLPDVVAELLCAHAFLPLSDDSTGVPALPQRAFLHFLGLLSRHTWSTEPLLLDWNLELSTDQREDLVAAFRSDRDSFPALCVFTPWDTTSRVSTVGPTVPELQRLRLLAAGALQHVEQRQHHRQLFSPAGLFKPNLTGYHVLIHLQTDLNARRHEALIANVQFDAVEYDSSLPNKMPIVNFNPAEIYLQQLRENYSDFAVFFHDVHGGDVIAVLWKPHVLDIQDFKISQVGGMKLLQKEQKLQVNVDAIIEDFYILGEGIVKNIEVN